MTTTPMMACGHAANSTTGDGAPACAICFGIDRMATQIMPPPDLSGREMLCNYAKAPGSPGGGKYFRPGDHDPKPSTSDAAFFEYLPDRPFDRFYCGCWGWD